MGRVKLTREERFVQKYLKKHGRLKVLKIFNKELEERKKRDECKSMNSTFKKPKLPARKKSEEDTLNKNQTAKEGPDCSKSSPNTNEVCKPAKLSFTIQKPPERKKIDIEPVKGKKKKELKIEEDEREPKTVDIPEDFKKIAKKFGLPEEHLDFFYEYRTSFNWEFKDKTEIHCTETTCKFTTKIGPKCLVDHMVTVHDYKEVPCGHVDCSYVAYSHKHLNLHKSRFHSHGRKPTDYGIFSCPFPSCKNSFRFPALLRRHVNVHKNILLSCNYCPYKVSDSSQLQLHLSIHFNIKNFICDVCSKKFNCRGHLNAHMRIIHSNDDYECQDCGLQTASLSVYYRHRKTCEKRLQHSRII